MTENVIYKKKTNSGLLQVVDTMYGDDAVCFLKINDSIQSAMYLDTSKKYDLVFPYMQRFSYAFHVNPMIQKTFLIGGGGFAYPKYYVHAYENAEITVSEIDTDMISAAFRYFALRDLAPSETSRVHILNQDGFLVLKESKVHYDLIINDAFVGKKEKGRDEMCTEIVHNALGENGIYIVNVSTAMRGPFAKRGNAFRKALQKYFKHTVLLAAEEERSPYEKQNVLMISSDMELL